MLTNKKVIEILNNAELSDEEFDGLYEMLLDRVKNNLDKDNRQVRISFTTDIRDILYHVDAVDKMLEEESDYDDSLITRCINNVICDSLGIDENIDIKID